MKINKDKMLVIKKSKARVKSKLIESSIEN